MDWRFSRKNIFSRHVEKRPGGSDYRMKAQITALPANKQRQRPVGETKIR
jgi:hypothetical protein